MQSPRDYGPRRKRSPTSDLTPPRTVQRERSDGDGKQLVDLQRRIHCNSRTQVKGAPSILRGSGDSLMSKNRGAGFVVIARAVAALAIFLFSPVASGLDPVQLPAAAAVVAFELVKPGEQRPVIVPELEALGLHRVTTQSPWEKGELTFEGVLFSDVVEYLGFRGARAVRIRALDGYVQDVPREDWLDKPLLLATRQDGVPLVRRTQGPTRLVYPLLEYPDYQPVVQDPRWVWLITTLEPLD
jgi:hypothetical protein